MSRPHTSRPPNASCTIDAPGPDWLWLKTRTEPPGGVLGYLCYQVQTTTRLTLTIQTQPRTLAEIVRFYNTRDTLKRVCADNNDPGFGRDCWPRPEVAANVNTEELGNLGLSAEDEAALVAFMQTLTDGYPDWGQDPNVPPNTPSPFLHMPVPPLP